jgi:integrase
MTWDNVVDTFESKLLGVKREKTGAEVDPRSGGLVAALGEGRSGYWIKDKFTGGRLARESFGNFFSDAVLAAGSPQGQVGCSLQCLQGTNATRLANNGAPIHEIMSVTGHKTLSEVQRYTKAAGQRRLAIGAINKFADTSPSKPRI